MARDKNTAPDPRVHELKSRIMFQFNMHNAWDKKNAMLAQHAAEAAIKWMDERPKQ